VQVYQTVTFPFEVEKIDKTTLSDPKIYYFLTGSRTLSPHYDLSSASKGIRRIKIDTDLTTFSVSILFDYLYLAGIY